MYGNLEPLDSLLLSDEAFSIARYRSCFENDHNCLHADTTWHPTRLVNIVCHGQSPTLRLVTPSKLLVCPPYVALSHCWGTRPMLKLTSTSLSDMKKNINYTELSKTFQEAIKVLGWLKGQWPWIKENCSLIDLNSFIYLDRLSVYSARFNCRLAAGVFSHA